MTHYLGHVPEGAPWFSLPRRLQVSNETMLPVLSSMTEYGRTAGSRKTSAPCQQLTANGSASRLEGVPVQPNQTINKCPFGGVLVTRRYSHLSGERNYSGVGSVWVWFCSISVNCVADSIGESIGSESPNRPRTAARMPAREVWPSLVFVIDAHSPVSCDAIINGRTGSIREITAVPEQGSNVQVGVAEDELAGKEQVFVTKDPHAWTAHVTGLNHIRRIVPEHKSRLGLKANSA